MIRNIIFDVGRVLVEYDPFTYMKRRGYTDEEQEIIRKAVFQNPYSRQGADRDGGADQRLCGKCAGA